MNLRCGKPNQVLNLSVSASRDGPDVGERWLPPGRSNTRSISQLIKGRLRFPIEIPTFSAGPGVGVAGVKQEDRACNFSERRNDNQSIERWKVREGTHLFLPILKVLAKH